MTRPPIAVRDAGSRSRDLFLWAVAIAVGGVVLAVLVRLVPSAAVHTAGLMFIPLLVPVLVVVAIVSIVLGVVALLRARRRQEPRSMRLLVPPIGSALLIVAIPGLVLVAQLLVTGVGSVLA